MRPQDRENWRYSNGSDNPIDIEERVMFSLLPKPSKGRLLDIGCGIGTISLELQKIGFKVYGIDFSAVAIEKAKKKGINAIKCDVDKDGILFKDNYFDVVWAGDIVEHVFDPIFLLKEISRVLKKTGKVLITIPNDFNLMRRIHIFISGKSPQSDIYKRLRQCKHHTLFSLELLEYMLNEAGLNSYYIHSVVKIPQIKKKKYFKGRIFAALFGATFIIEAYKKNAT